MNETELNEWNRIEWMHTELIERMNKELNEWIKIWSYGLTDTCYN